MLKSAGAIPSIMRSFASSREVNPSLASPGLGSTGLLGLFVPTFKKLPPTEYIRPPLRSIIASPDVSLNAKSLLSSPTPGL